MSTGQSLLAVGAILLLMLVGAGLNQSYVSAISETVEQQQTIEAINYSQAMSERILSASNAYDSLDSLFGNRDNVANPSQRFTHVTAFGDSLYATVELSQEQLLRHNVSGRIVTITVYEQDGSNFIPKATQYVTLNRIES